MEHVTRVIVTIIVLSLLLLLLILRLKVNNRARVLGIKKGSLPLMLQAILCDARNNSNLSKKTNDFRDFVKYYDTMTMDLNIIRPFRRTNGLPKKTFITEFKQLDKNLSYKEKQASFRSAIERNTKKIIGLISPNQSSRSLFEVSSLFEMEYKVKFEKDIIKERDNICKNFELSIREYYSRIDNETINFAEEKFRYINKKNKNILESV